MIIGLESHEKIPDTESRATLYPVSTEARLEGSLRCFLLQNVGISTFTGKSSGLVSASHTLRSTIQSFLTAKLVEIFGY